MALVLSAVGRSGAPQAGGGELPSRLCQGDQELEPLGTRGRIGWQLRCCGHLLQQGKTWIEPWRCQLFLVWLTC